MRPGPWPPERSSQKTRNDGGAAHGAAPPFRIPSHDRILYTLVTILAGNRPVGRWPEGCPGFTTEPGTSHVTCGK